MEENLSDLRNKISQIDKDMALLFEERMATARKIAKYKQANGLPIEDKIREQSLIESDLNYLKDEGLQKYYLHFLKNTLLLSKACQSDYLFQAPSSYDDSQEIIIPIMTQNDCYSVYLCQGGITDLNKHLDLKRKVLVLTDDGVPTSYLKTVLSQLSTACTLVLKQGEATKNTDTLRSVLGELTTNGFTRSDCILALGGGVVSDIAGFAASLYMRDIDYYTVPTTLLAQVDASVGGKTAVNFMGFKNSIGSFYSPKAVIADTDTLITLPKRQLCNGLAEAIKMGMTHSVSILDLIAKEDIISVLPQIVENCVRVKAAIIENDYRENGLRRVLNFGHTVGHALESTASPGSHLHGECVALGMLTMCSPTAKETLLPLLNKTGLPTQCDFDTESVLNAVRHDKKAQNDRIHCITVDTPGSYRFTDLSLDEIELRLKSIQRSDDP